MNWGWDDNAFVLRYSVTVTYASSPCSFATAPERKDNNKCGNRGGIERNDPSVSLATKAFDSSLCNDKLRLLRSCENQNVTRVNLSNSQRAITGLTARQREVLNLIVQGRSNKEIARSLCLAEGTVKIHVAALFGKVGVHRRAALAAAGARFLSTMSANPQVSHFGVGENGYSSAAHPVPTFHRSGESWTTPSGRIERELSEEELIKNNHKTSRN